jgi:hypothetical protein
MDPFVNYHESVDITFEVKYDTQVTYEDHWKDAQPILIVIGIIIVIILIIAVIQRSSSKKAAVQAATTAGKTVTEPSKAVEKKCHRCEFTYKPGDTYCNNCGAKLEGRDYGTSKITTPADSKWCKSCGNTIKPDSSYCRTCGAAIEKTTDTHKYFPDERKSFFCQLDNEQHPSTDSAYMCDKCSRMICGNCYDDIGKTGVQVCPYCKGELRKTQ